MIVLYCEVASSVSDSFTTLTFPRLKLVYVAFLQLKKNIYTASELISGINRHFKSFKK